ncbi:2-octaprenyl-6-methoxyphenyl hydroxylase [Rheinheimera texasensis]|uniref:2-octaprenyl-6-methoxyphenyl hydroxylase n=1 Tax=Rheinheimera texasensis TaxID=306205 RepID=UPI000A6DB52D|nr:2-octaprenyl-6-methoxyphenyl hydroxylase [Rheinheimera texasensis]
MSSAQSTAPHNNHDHNFDLVIAGGGMTGAMLALQISRQLPALRIAIIEQQPEQQNAGQLSADTTAQHTSSFDSRSIALSAGSVGLLATWGIWPELKSHACAIEHIQVSDRGHFGKSRLTAAEFGRSALGYVIEIEWIGRLLYQQLQQVPASQLTWFRPDQISAIRTERDCQHLQLQSGAALRCRLLVLCEGGDSPSRALAGVDSVQHDYQQSALIANIAVASPHQGKAFERFTADGPLALLPLTQQRYSLVWTCQPEQALALKALPDNEFVAALQHAFGYSAGVFNGVGNRVVYPLKLKTAAKAADHRLVLCGNSLHNLHPIAGQGFNLALRDLDALLQLLALHCADAGAYGLTRQYQQLRSADMAQVVGFTDSLVRLFSNDSKLLALGRSIGLSVLNQCDMLKQPFAALTMGLSPLASQKQLITQQQIAHQQAANQAAVTAASHAAKAAATGHSSC